ncbi:hypothetical protein OHB25_57800 [Streptomyces mirabilis]|nr:MULTISPECIES: hypothetical protein [Streptomyces]MCX4617617.1 hypothetical protein [Streptomyces mirabilis]QDN93368.1 hypothetical protein FNV61_55635 [Streptomyces sp. RLB3-6]QDO05143.1 hypothetical protein FNV68_00905 [Streptomyces sp. S1D4-23]
MRMMSSGNGESRTAATEGEGAVELGVDVRDLTVEDLHTFYVRSKGRWA